MTKKKTEEYLKSALNALEAASAQAQKSKVLTEESRRLLILRALVEEQIPNENPDHTVSATR